MRHFNMVIGQRARCSHWLLVQDKTYNISPKKLDLRNGDSNSHLYFYTNKIVFYIEKRLLVLSIYLWSFMQNEAAYEEGGGTYPSLENWGDVPPSGKIKSARRERRHLLASTLNLFLRMDSKFFSLWRRLFTLNEDFLSKSKSCLHISHLPRRTKNEEPIQIQRVATYDSDRRKINFI